MTISPLRPQCPAALFELEMVDRPPLKTIHCVSQNCKFSLQVEQLETVLQLSVRLAENIKIPSSDLLLICKGRIISHHPFFSLQDLGLFTTSPECKLIVSKRPPGPVWPRIKTLFLCSNSLSPLVFRMHADSPIACVKRQLRELLRCPAAVLCLHLADGATLPDTVTLRDLGVTDGFRLYCRIRSDESDALSPSPLVAAAATVREQVRQADAAHCDGVGRKRRRDDNHCGRLRSGRAEAFLGLRKGFLCGAEARRRPERFAVDGGGSSD